MKLRTFLKCGLVISTLQPNPGNWLYGDDVKRRIGVIGHTGRGNFGHGLDTVWSNISYTQIVGVSDPDSKGLKKAVERLNVNPSSGFESYNQMLSKVKPEFVAICPRHVDQHLAMVESCIKNGVRGIYIEKPFCQTPAQADKIIKLCLAGKTKLAVAHRNRYHPVIHLIKKMMDKGELGKILEIRSRGKGDHRGGGEDLWVLGTHVLDLLHYFAGKPISCSASCFQDGKLAQPSDVRMGNEGLGLILGNEIHARYQHESGVTSFFDSIVHDKTNNYGFGLMIVGSKAQVRIFCDESPVAFYQEGNPFKADTNPKRWIPISSSGVGRPEAQQKYIAEVQNHIVPVKDLIAAIDSDNTPMCSMIEGAMTVEMVHSIFASHVQNGQRVQLPLPMRENYLKRYSD